MARFLQMMLPKDSKISPNYLQKMKENEIQELNTINSLTTARYLKREIEFLNEIQIERDQLQQLQSKMNQEDLLDIIDIQKKGYFDFQNLHLFMKQNLFVFDKEDFQAFLRRAKNFKKDSEQIIEDNELLKILYHNIVLNDSQKKRNRNKNLNNNQQEIYQGKNQSNLNNMNMRRVRILQDDLQFRNNIFEDQDQNQMIYKDQKNYNQYYQDQKIKFNDYINNYSKDISQQPYFKQPKSYRNSQKNTLPIYDESYQQFDEDLLMNEFPDNFYKTSQKYPQINRQFYSKIHPHDQFFKQKFNPNKENTYSKFMQEDEDFYKYPAFNQFEDDQLYTKNYYSNQIRQNNSLDNNFSKYGKSPTPKYNDYMNSYFDKTLSFNKNPKEFLGIDQNTLYQNQQTRYPNKNLRNTSKDQ